MVKISICNHKRKHIKTRDIICVNCNVIYTKPSCWPKSGKFCSVKCSRDAISKTQVGRKAPWTTKRNLDTNHTRSGENHWKWLKDRTLLKKDNLRNDSAYKEWRKEVWERDGFKCRIADNKCNGRIEAHHILSWSEHLELRYKVNNGITLCHAHHPRKRAEEKRLIPTFQELVSVSK